MELLPATFRSTFRALSDRLAAVAAGTPGGSWALVVSERAEHEAALLALLRGLRPARWVQVPVAYEPGHVAARSLEALLAFLVTRAAVPGTSGLRPGVAALVDPLIAAAAPFVMGSDLASIEAFLTADALDEVPAIAFRLLANRFVPALAARMPEVPVELIAACVRARCGLADEGHPTLAQAVASLDAWDVLRAFGVFARHAGLGIVLELAHVGPAVATLPAELAAFEKIGGLAAVVPLLRADWDARRGGLDEATARALEVRALGLTNPPLSVLPPSAAVPPPAVPVETPPAVAMPPGPPAGPAPSPLPALPRPSHVASAPAIVPRLERGRRANHDRSSRGVRERLAAALCASVAVGALALLVVNEGDPAATARVAVSGAVHGASPAEVSALHAPVPPRSADAIDAPRAAPLASQPREPAGEGARPDTMPPPRPAPMVPAASPRVLPGVARPAPVAAPRSRTKLVRQVRAEVLRAMGVDARLRALERAIAVLPRDGQAALLTSLLENPRCGPGEADVFRNAVVDRLTPLADEPAAATRVPLLLAPARSREDKLAAMRLLSRGRMPLDGDTARSVAAIVEHSSGDIALEFEARALLRASSAYGGEVPTVAPGPPAPIEGADDGLASE